MSETPQHPAVRHAVHLRRQQHLERMGSGLAGAVRRADDSALTGLSRVFGWPVTVWLFFALPLVARFLGAAFQSQFFYYSSGWVQLFALPLLTYISVKLQRSSDAQSEVAHIALTHIATVEDQNRQLLEQNTELTAQVHGLVTALNDRPPVQPTVQVKADAALTDAQVGQMVAAIQKSVLEQAKRGRMTGIPRPGGRPQGDGRMNIIMFDSVDVAQIPAGPPAVAGYSDGRFQTLAELEDRFPHARILSIATSPAHDADCLDVETGDASPADVPGWYDRQRGKGATRPCLYASASVMQAGIVPLVKSGRIPRASVRLWSAHYAGQHICSRTSCGLVSIGMDGTQWTDRAWGRSLDESLLLADFFGAVSVPGQVPAWQEAMMNKLPVLQEGARDTAEPWMVRRVQALCNALGTPCAIDGDFGPATKTAVEAVQHEHGITADGIIGPVAWSVLVTGSVP